MDHNQNISNNFPVHRLCWPGHCRNLSVILLLHFKSSDIIQSYFLDFLKKVMITLLKKESNLSFWPWCVLNVEKGLNMQGMFLFWMVLEIFPVTFSKLGTQWGFLTCWDFGSPFSHLLSLLCQEPIDVLVFCFLDVLILFHELNSGSGLFCFKTTTERQLLWIKGLTTYCYGKWMLVQIEAI